jgi:monoamine oxidase
MAKIAKIPLERAEVRLNTKVVTFATKNDPATASTTVELTTSEKDTLQFDAVVVTTPLGWLKFNKRAFQPPLPPALDKAIDGISVGHLEKVYILFSEAFWEKRTANSPSGEPSHTNHTIWLNPLYASDTNPSAWLIEGYGIPASVAHSRSTLLIYTSGHLSEHICSLVHSTRDRDEQHNTLDAFFRPYYSRLPGYDPERPECKPREFLASMWRYDEFAGFGSYSYMQVGVDGADRHIQSFQDGMPDRGIYFAGEHVAPTTERGTMAGAWLSGELAARKLMRGHGMSRN